jgi:hypothetical protein
MPVQTFHAQHGAGLACDQTFRDGAWQGMLEGVMTIRVKDDKIPFHLGRVLLDALTSKSVVVADFTALQSGRDMSQGHVFCLATLAANL